MSDRRSFRSHIYCDSCRCAVAVRVQMQTPIPTTAGQARTAWLMAADRECRVRFEIEHAWACRGRAR